MSRTAAALGSAAAMLIGAAGTCWSMPAAALATPPDSVTMVSQTGDFIGGGSHYVFDTATGTVTLEGTGSHASVRVSGGSDPSGLGFTLNFASPGGAQLEEKEYVEARRYPFEPSSLPGIDVNGDGRTCNEDYGRFIVKDVHADATGNLDRLWLLFEQHCESAAAPALFGEVHVGEPAATELFTEPAEVAWPQTEVGETGTNVPVTVIAGPAGADITAVAISGSNAGDFHIRKDACLGTLVPEGRCQVTVGMKPLAAGDRTAELDITDSEGAVARVVLAMITTPSVSSVTPNLGPPSGGTTVTIRGGGFTGATEVRFGSLPASSFTVDSATEITATTPPASIGTVDVTVTTARGTSPTRAADVFRYANVPDAPTEVSAVAEAAGARVSFTAPAANGSTITEYIVEGSPGTVTATGAASPIVVTGLTRGQAYTFTVRARNAVGTGPPSAPSNPVTLREATTISLLPSPASSVFGTPLSFDVLVAATGSVPTGTVQFSVEGFQIGPPEALNAQGRLVEPPLGVFDVGTSLTATYSGDPGHEPSSTTIPLAISPAATRLSVTSSANPQTAGSPVTVTATVSNLDTQTLPFGSVQFVVNGQPVLEREPLSPAGTASIIGHLPVGTYSISAEFKDDTGKASDFKESRGSLTQVIQPSPAPPPGSTPPPPPSPAPAAAADGVQAFNNALIIVGHPVVSRTGRIRISAQTVDPGQLKVVAHTRAGFLAARGQFARKRRPGPAIYGTAFAKTSGSKAVALIVVPNARAKHALSLGRTLHLTLVVSFVSSRGGQPTRVTLPVTVKGRRGRPRG